MIGAAVFRGIPKGQTAFEHLPFYEEAGKKYGVTPCYFRFEDITPGVRQVNAYVKNEQGTYILQAVPRPDVIHNRVFKLKPAQRRKIKKLKKEGIIFFNEYNRYRKLKVNDILSGDPLLRPHVPETLRADEKSVKLMMKKHDELILKPNSGTLGLGIVKLSKRSGGVWELTLREKDSLISECFSETFPPRLKELLSRKNVIVQQRIPLAKSRGGVFDMRVSVQKNRVGVWQVSGIVGKVAKKGWYMTNVARGGSCRTFRELMEDLPHLTPEGVYENMEGLAISAAGLLEKHLPPLADLGFDMGITEEGFPMFIECNCRDLRYSFKNAGMMEEWKNTHVSPVGYACHLLEATEARG
jgi:glutathione synthase/RimK-type ligase-like ATP-grasp enzyme